MFAAITPALIFGAAAERLRLIPCIVFIFLWTTLSYDFIAYWTWAPNGWLNVRGNLDFAGGTPVHISSGFAALAYSIVLGRRKGLGTEEFKPHSLNSVVLGTALLWFGWFGFNGGSAFKGNARAGMACIVTNIAASVGGLVWMTLDFRHQRKFSAFGFCNGVVAGLVCITPASGFVSPWASVIFGAFAGVICHFAIYIKNFAKFDDALDVFAIHGIGGITGCVLTGIFAQKWIAALDGTIIQGGWVDGHFVQIGWQIAGAVSGAAWSFTISLILLVVLNFIPGLRLRLDEDMEEMGVDMSQIGELAHHHVNEKSFLPPSINEPETVLDDGKV
eukprot:TRINITY_DN4597_c0_g1_i1.p1 TRINITY_DN4597_c0_g1~~TRINITY_DN4597_c0_g1_i1.p1  ORF type:complete len:332 (+),score=38.68 TRINITY_DN4597_c0_g1_i1:134-1129(+)